MQKLKRTLKKALPDSTRNVYLSAIIALFVVSVSFSYLIYEPDLGIEMNVTGSFADEETGRVNELEFQVRNFENQDIDLEAWIMGGRDNGPRTLDIGNTSIEPGETVRFTGEPAKMVEGLSPSEKYHIIVKDQNSGKIFSKAVSFDQKYPSDRNPYFIETEGYRYHWSGSISGNGEYSLHRSGRGLNSSFFDCKIESSCGLSYRDDYNVVERVIVEGRGYKVGRSNLTLNIAGKEVPVEFENTGGESYRFNKTVRLDSLKIDAEEKEVIRYGFSFETVGERFHWFEFERYSFVES